MQSNEEKNILVIGSPQQGKTTYLEKRILPYCSGRVIYFNPKNNKMSFKFDNTLTFKDLNYLPKNKTLVNRTLKKGFTISNCIDYLEKYPEISGTVFFDDFTILTSNNSSKEMERLRNFLSVQRQRKCSFIFVLHSFNFLNNMLADLITDFVVFKSSGYKRIDKRFNCKDEIIQLSERLENSKKYSYYIVSNLNPKNFYFHEKN